LYVYPIAIVSPFLPPPLCQNIPMNISHATYYVILTVFTEQIGSSNNASDMYLGGVLIEPQRRQRLHWLNFRGFAQSVQKNVRIVPQIILKKANKN
jgi:hypothetical protein